MATTEGDAAMAKANAAPEGPHHCVCGHSSCRLLQWLRRWLKGPSLWATLLWPKPTPPVRAIVIAGDIAARRHALGGSTVVT